MEKQIIDPELARQTERTTFEVTIPVTFKVLADCDAEAEHAAMDAVEAIELTDGIIEVGYTCSPRGPWAKRVEVVRG